MKFLELLEEASKQENVNEIMTSWSEIIDDYICKTKEENSKVYNDMINDLYVTIYGEHINEDIARKWVSGMKPVGEHWTIEETKTALPSLQEAEGYTIANMLYNDYYDIVKDNEDIIIGMALAWSNINNLFEFWKYHTQIKKG